MNVSSLLSRIDEVFSVLDSNYVILRGIDNKGNLKGDIDYLVNDLEDTKILIDKLGLKVVKVQSGYCYLGYFVVYNDNIIQIDFFSDLVVKWFSYGDKTEALQNKVWNKSWFILDDDYIKLLKKKRLNCKSYSFSKLAVLMTIKLFSFSLYRYLYSSITRALDYNLTVFLAPDGSGKSTLIEQFSEYIIKNRLYTSTKVYHLRPKLIPRLGRENEVVEPNLNVNYSKVINRVSILRYNTLSIYYFFDFLLLYFRLIISGFKNEMVIFDRYYYDYLIYHNYPVDCKINFARFASYCVPQPDYVITISGNPSLIANKKKELTVEQTELQFVNIKNISFGSNVNVINLNQNYDGNILGDLIREIN